MCMECKITDFEPQSSMQIPNSQEAMFWPFSRNKKGYSEKEKLEFFMLKDIYSLGICILELMIGRTNLKVYSISLERLPLAWAEFYESGPLIAALQRCIMLDST